MEVFKAAKCLNSLILSTVISIGLMLPALAGLAHASGPVNLVPNADLSQLDSNSLPVSWHTDNWGTNSPHFTFTPSSPTTSANLRVDVQNYQNGDAKWFFDPVSITAGNTYEFSDTYESNAVSNVWAQFLDSQNSPSYQWIGSLASSIIYKDGDFTFTVPNNIKQVSIFHVLNANGYLQTKDFSLIDVTPPPANGNSVPDPDLNQTDPSTSRPMYWYTDSWGSNSASFSYASPSPTSAGFLRVDMQNYQSGDAKWWFNPVNVTPGDTYQFTDTYLSNSITNVWARYLDSQNSPSYVWLGSDAADVASSRASFAMTVPLGAVNVTIFHVLNTNGYLETSSFSLIDTTGAPSSCQPALTDGIYNNSFEETCDNDTSEPAWWSHAIYGQATASFDYLNSGHTGSHSVDINLTSADGGEAGWYFKPMAVSPNQRYQFNFWYDSTIYAYAYTEITLSDDSVIYQPMMSVPASGSVWSDYQDAFITPANAKTITIHIATSNVGQVILDDFSLKQLPNYASNDFNRPIISIDFDDGWSSQYTNGLPVLNQLGLKATFYINSGTLGTSSYMTSAQVKALASNYGEEIGSHSYYHDNLVNLSLNAAQNEITTNNTYLQNLTSQSIYDFATPYGSYNTPILDYIMQLHQTQRDTSGQLNFKYNFNPRVIHSVLITKETTTSQINSLIQQAKTSGAWLIFTYHGIANGGDDYTITKSALQKQLQVIESSGVAVETTHQAYNEIEPQL